MAATGARAGAEVDGNADCDGGVIAAVRGEMEEAGEDDDDEEVLVSKLRGTEDSMSRTSWA